MIENDDLVKINRWRKFQCSVSNQHRGYIDFFVNDDFWQFLFNVHHISSRRCNKGPFLSPKLSWHRIVMKPISCRLPPSMPMCLPLCIFISSELESIWNQQAIASSINWNVPVYWVRKGSKMTERANRYRVFLKNVLHKQEKKVLKKRRWLDRETNILYKHNN